MWPAIFIVAITAWMLYAKRYMMLDAILPSEWWAHPFTLIGISYISFKSIHAIVDGYQGQLPRITLASYLNYQRGFA